MPKIAVITGSRADGNPLSPVIHVLGDQCTQINTDGLFGHEAYIRQRLQGIKPDMVLLLGDRFETLTAAHVAAYMQIPIAHIHGGETTEGSTDDKYRHAISMLSDYHFVSHAKYSRRLKAMGLPQERIFVMGAPGVDLLVQPVVPVEQTNFAVVCVHPEISQINMAEICHHFDGYSTVFIAAANDDPGGDEINGFWQLLTKHDTRIVYRPGFDSKIWQSLMFHADVLIGNSSGFIFEGMTLGKKLIMVGNRQRGRYDDALEFFKHEQYPYGRPGTVAPAIAQKLLELA